jgi:hypothetical protein
VSPIESSQACIGATISGMFARMFGSEATNWLIELDSAWATVRMMKTSAPTIAGVDQDRRHLARQARDRGDDAGDDRADDEGEQPRQEEREQRVAEVEDPSAVRLIAR